MAGYITYLLLLLSFSFDCVVNGKRCWLKKGEHIFTKRVFFKTPVHLQIVKNDINFFCLEYVFTCLFAVHILIILSRHEPICLTRQHFERYFSYHWST